MSTYTFPVLDIPVIVETIGDMGVRLTEADLKKPTQEALRPVYEAFLLSILDITREDLQQPSFAALEGLQHPELYEEGFSNLAFSRSVQKMMKLSGIKDFKMQDLYKPEPARTKRQLEAVINLGKYKEDGINKFTERYERRLALQERLQQLAETRNAITARIQMLQATKAAEEPKIRALQQGNEAMKRTITDLSKRLAAVQREMRHLQSMVAAEKGKINDLKFQHTHDLTRRNQLLGQIIEAPEKLQGALVQLNLNIEKEQKSVVELDSRSRELQARNDVLAKAEKEVKKCIKLTEEVETEYLRYKETSKALKGTKAKTAANEEEVERLLNKIRSLQRHGQSVLERLQKSEVQGMARTEAAMQKLKEAQSNKASAGAAYAAAEAHANEVHGQVRAVTEKLAAANRDHERQERELAEECEALIEQVRLYKKRLLEVMKPPPPLPANESLEDCLRV